MAIGDDFAIDYTNLRIYHTANNNTYTTRALYSEIMDSIDESSPMAYSVPMKALTPNSFQMINGWFLDIGEDSEAHKYLKEGSIETVGYNNAIRLLKMESCAYTFTTSDIGKEIGYNGGTPTDVGTLLGYDNTLNYVWVRTTDSFTNTTTSLDMDDTQVLDDLIDTNGSLTGEEIYVNVYTITGQMATGPAPQVYIFQDGSRISEWSDKDNWDRGDIDILIQIQEMGTEIDAGNITVFARQMGDTFAFYEVDLTGKTREPLVLNTNPDSNYNTTPDGYLLIDNVAGGTPSANDVVYHPTSGTVEWYFEIVTATNITGAEWLIAFRGLREVSGSLTDNDACGNGTWTADVNGTQGDAYFDYTPGTDFTTNGQILTQATSNAKALQRGYSAAGDTVVCETDTSQEGSNLDDYIKDMDTTNLVTGATDGSATPDNYARGVAGFVDITIGHINGTVTCSSFSGTFETGELVNYTNPSASAIMAYTDGSTTMTLANVDSSNEPTATSVFTGASSGATCNCDSTLTDDNTEGYNYPLQSVYQYNVIVECGAVYRTSGYGRGVSEVYEYMKYVCRDGSTFTIYTSDGSSITELDGEEYIRATSSYTEKLVASYGYMAGAVLFGAQGVFFDGMASADANNVKTTDTGGTLREPDPQVTIKLSNTVASDRVGVYLDDGSGAVDKDTYTSHATNNAQSDSTLEIQENIPNDTPLTGHVVVVAVDEDEEHSYRYASWTGKIFTLITERTGTADADSSGNTLEDDAADFVSWGIQYGDIIRNTTDGTWGYVVSVTDLDTLVTVTGFGSNALTWDNLDAYEIGSLVQGYDGSDTAYVPWMLGKAGGTSIEKTVNYVSDRDVVIKARNVEASTKIQPFVTTSQITSSGMTVSVIRNEDTIYQ